MKNFPSTKGSNAGTRKVGLYVKKDDRAAGKAEEFADWLKARKIEVIRKISPGSLSRGSGPGPARPPKDLFCVFVLGGDGTFLSAVRWMATARSRCSASNSAIWGSWQKLRRKTFSKRPIAF